MFRTVLLPIIRSLITIFTAIGICYTKILKMGKITVCVCVCVCVCVYVKFVHRNLPTVVHRCV